MKGLDFEEYVAEILRKKGFRKVSIAKATDDFGVDITCNSRKGKDKYAIQVKRYKSPLSGHAIQEVIAGAKYYNANKTMVITNSTFTTKAKILAKSNNCELIDRYILQRWVYENETTLIKKNTKDKNNNEPIENVNLSVVVNPLTASAQYMNFDDVPFIPEQDELNETKSTKTEEIIDSSGKVQKNNDVEPDIVFTDSPLSVGSSNENEDIDEHLPEIEIVDPISIETNEANEVEDIDINPNDAHQDYEISVTPVEKIDNIIAENFFDDL